MFAFVAVQDNWTAEPGAGEVPGLATHAARVGAPAVPPTVIVAVAVVVAEPFRAVRV
jgi:hypothetical protein